MWASSSGGPRFADEAFAGLSLMLAGEAENPTHRRELLRSEALDYSLGSLRHVDEYLAAVHRTPPCNSERMQLVLRGGAYLGEVMRRARPGVFHWVLYEEGARLSAVIREMPESLATAGILWRDPQCVAFPLEKVCKALENGSSESLYAFGCLFTRG